MNKLFLLGDDTVLYPGHDYKRWTAPGIGEERRFDRRLAGKTDAEYVANIESLNLPNPKMMDVALPANLALCNDFFRGRVYAVSRLERTMKHLLLHRAQSVATALIVCGLSWCTSASAAQTMSIAPPTVAHMQEALRRNLGQSLTVSSVSTTPLSGLYEVDVDKQIIYTDSAANYLLVGQMIEARTHKNLTVARLEKENHIDFDAFPLGNAIKTIHGQGRRKIAIFADPYCPYCKKLEQTLQGLDDVTIYTFLVPILAPDSKPMSEAIWCSRDSNAAWNAWMLLGKKPSSASACSDLPVEANLALAKRLRITGTPTIVYGNGAQQVGALSLSALNEGLNAK